MTEQSKKIFSEYIEKKSDYEKLGSMVSELLKKLLNDSENDSFEIGFRVKTEESLTGKLERKGDKYKCLKDITDILGARIITLFSDSVDRVGKIIEENFVIDWENSVDKRKNLKASEFGYLSVHYICSLPDNKGYPKELCGIRFEIQVRSALQHIWSEINHDIGYKSIFSLPRSCMRSFSKLASLMEIADEMACNLRDDINSYIQEVHEKIAENHADDIEIDSISLKEYVKTNNHMKNFFQNITAECGIEVSFAKFDTLIFLHQLEWLGFTTLGDIQKMFERCNKIAMKYVHYTFDPLDLDIISSSAGLRFMFNAELIVRNETRERIEDFYSISIPEKEVCKRLADDLLIFKEKMAEL